jgi:hypothetical protein
VQLDGVGRLRFKVTEHLRGDLLAATVSRDAAGRWFPTRFLTSRSLFFLRTSVLQMTGSYLVASL